MTDYAAENKKAKTSLWLDYGPIFAYVLVFNIARRINPDTALYVGAAVFAIAVIIAVVYSKLKYNRVSPILCVTAVIVIGTVAITLIFQNKTVFYMKPTALNILFGGTIIGSLLVKKNAFKLLMGDIYTLPDEVWRILAWRWGFFFFVLAGINEYVWRNFSEAFWSNFKIMGMLPISLAFGLLNLPLLLKYITPDTDTPDQTPPKSE